MAGHEWEDWFEREEFIGQISDIRVQNLQVERELVQKRTFTRWINLHLEKCNPPMEVHDLFRDIQDGRILMALLEELSGCKLLQGFKQSSHRIFRLNNIAKVLTFLEERNVKLVSIDAADVADGNSSIVLGLIWNIILFFQIKELTGNIKNQFPSSSSLSSIPTSSDSDTSHSSTPSEERRCSVAIRDQGKAIKTLLQWVQRRTKKFGVAVNDFGKSWTSGLAFLAVIKSIDPSLVDMRRALLRTPRENLEEAFRTAHYSLGIPRLLEPEDVTINPPDEQVIMTYVSQFLEHFPGMDEDDVSVIDRGTSKVNARLNDSVARNGVKRTRETSSYVVKRDWVKPPPKIFISSVSDESSDQHVAPPQPVPSTKPWTSEDSKPSPAESSPSPSPADDCSPTRSLDLTKDPPCSVSASTSCSSSPQPSYVDSVISSPDSWSEMPSEVGPLEKLPVSYSDGSLNEASLVCDPKESVTYITSQTPDKELPLDTGKPLDDGTDSELFIDEGNFSLCSLDSLQAKTPLPSEEDDAPTHISSAQGQDKVLEPGAITNGSDKVSEEMVLHETVKPSPADLSEAGCESGYFPEDKDSSLSLVETASVPFDSSEQIVKDENKSKEEPHHLEKADHLQSSNDTKTPDPEITREADQITDQITDADKPAVAPGCPVSGNGIQLPESESDIHSKDALLTDTLAAQQDDIHYAETVDVESVEDSDSCDGEVLEQPSRELEVEMLKGGEQPEEGEAKQLEKVEEEMEEEEEEEQEQVKLGMDDTQGLGAFMGPGASGNVLDQRDRDEDSGEMADWKVEGASPGEETSDEITTERTDPRTADMTSDRNQEMTSRVDFDSEMIDKMDVSISAMMNDHKDKSGLFWEPQSPETEEKKSAPECKTEEEPGYRESKPEDVFSRSDSLITSQRDDTESSSAYPTGQTQSKSEELINGTECKTEGPVKEATESLCVERPTGGGESEFRHKPAGAGEEAEAGDSQGSVCDSVPNAGGSLLGKEEEEDVEEMDEAERAPVSVIPLDLVYYPHYDVPIAEVIEAFVDPSAADSRGLGEAGTGSHDLIGSGEASGGAEDYGSVPQELRLSLSVAPLQPAPVQDILPGPDTESSDSENEDRDRNHVPAETGKGLPQNMASDGPLQGQESCPSKPVEGLAETDRGAADPTGAGGPGEPINSDGEWTGARENTTAVREDATADEKQPSTGPYLRVTAQPIEAQSGRKTSEPCTPVKSSLHSRRESRAEMRGTPVELTLEEVCLLLILWLVVYCLFVLPQIDFRTLPHLLFNIEE